MPRLTPFRDELPIPDTVHPAHGIAGHHHLSIAAGRNRSGSIGTCH